MDKSLSHITKVSRSPLRAMTAIALAMLATCGLLAADAHAQVGYNQGAYNNSSSYNPCNPGGGGGGGTSYDGGSSGDYNIDSIDVDGDGNGDYADMSEAMAAGFDSGFSVSGGADYSADGADSGGGSTGDTVLCTHFYKQGRLDRDLWRASSVFTHRHNSPYTLKGYHYWAVPYVSLARKSKLAEAIIYPIVVARSAEVAYQLGWREKPHYGGKLVRFVMEPICYVIGRCASQRDWRSLWNGETVT